MPKKSPKKVLSTEQPKQLNHSMSDILSYIFLFILDAVILFSTRIPLHFFRWIVIMVVRGYIFFFLGANLDRIIARFPMETAETFHAFCYDFFIVVPIIIFLLWYFFTTLTMFLAPFYASNSFGYTTRPVSNSNDYSQINRFLNWRDNKMKFSSYKENTELMQQSAILNNLDQNDPEARKTLDYINNKMRFMSYQESLNFLKGGEK